MRNKKLKVGVFIIIGGWFIIYLITFLYGAITQDIRNSGGMTTAVPTNYINLFNNAAKRKLKVTYTSFAKYRDSISYLTYDKIYDLEIIKIKTDSNWNLEKDIIELYKKPEGIFPGGTVGIAPYNENNFVVNYKAESTEIASKIYLSLLGDSIKTVMKNDSVASYFLNVKNMYVQYKPDSVYQIYIEAKTEFYFYTIKQPVSLMFLMRHNSLYFLLLTTKSDKDYFDPNLLYKLIKEK